MESTSAKVTASAVPATEAHGVTVCPLRDANAGRCTPGQPVFNTPSQLKVGEEAMLVVGEQRSRSKHFNLSSLIYTQQQFLT